jgi:Xaa-Pro aminopeptidase
MRQTRLRRLRALLDREGLDAMVISALENIRYLTGFTGSHALCVITARSAHLLSDPRYRDQIAHEVRGFRRHIVVGELPFALAGLSILRPSWAAGFESGTVTYSSYRLFRKSLPRVHFVPTHGLVESLQAVKTNDEVERIQRAARISDQVFEEILTILRPGVTERDIAADISFRQRRAGGEGDAFEAIVAGGERGALPHARASNRKLRRGDMVTLDFGCIVGGYRSDLTRTVSIGRPSPEFRWIYDVVLQANQEALAAVRSGMAARDLDSVARGVFHRAGYGKWFHHSLGHGLGLRVHERPRISPLSRDVLTEGNVVTIEPGVYLPGKGGVRIEDDVLIRAHGMSLITHAPKELLIL